MKLFRIKNRFLRFIASGGLVILIIIGIFMSLLVSGLSIAGLGYITKPLVMSISPNFYGPLYSRDMFELY